MNLIEHQLDRFAEVVEADNSVVGFREVCDQVVGSLGLRKPRPALLIGPRGSGRSTALGALQAHLDSTSAKAVGRQSIVRIDCGRLAGLTVVELQKLREVAGETSVIAFDDIDLIMGVSGSTVNNDLLAAARAMIHDPALRLVASIDRSTVSALEVREAELTELFERIELPKIEGRELRAIASDQAVQLELHHEVALPAPIVETAAGPAPPSSKLVHPGLLVARLDAACLHARMRRSAVVETADLDLNHSSPQPAVVDRDQLAEALRERVSGQEQAVKVVSERLALTSRKLDLSAHRPDGVFLFVGPTGVGKTELALALAEARFGDEDRVIRLDMSEYGEEHNVSRMIGPPPGYVGSDSPSGWLTTRVRERPGSVIVLDEIEKAHRDVWMMLLQIFDAGRLTDGRGEVASFSDAVIIMTSNLGTGSSASRPVGFMAGEDAADDASREKIMDVVKKTMPPELVNRIDEVVVFRALPRDVIQQIAGSLIAKAIETLGDRGWVLEVPEEVVAQVAKDGYDPAYGARHVKRAIEGRLLASLATLTPGGYRARLEDDEITWQATGANSPGSGSGEPGRPSSVKPVELQASLRYGTRGIEAKALVITAIDYENETAAELLVDAVTEKLVVPEAAELLRNASRRPVMVRGLSATAAEELSGRLRDTGADVAVTGNPSI